MANVVCVLYEDPVLSLIHILGGLAVKPGSQHTSRVHYRPLDRLERGWLTTDYHPGDVLVFHCLTTHAALPNRGSRMRFSAEYRWQLADQPAPRRVVIGPQAVSYTHLPSVQLADDLADRIGRTLVADVVEHAGDRRRHLALHLVGLQEVHRLVLPDVGAVVDEPLGQRLSLIHI